MPLSAILLPSAVWYHMKPILLFICGKGDDYFCMKKKVVWAHDQEMLMRPFSVDG